MLSKKIVEHLDNNETEQSRSHPLCASYEKARRAPQKMKMLFPSLVVRGSPVQLELHCQSGYLRPRGVMRADSETWREFLRTSAQSTFTYLLLNVETQNLKSTYPKTQQAPQRESTFEGMRIFKFLFGLSPAVKSDRSRQLRRRSHRALEERKHHALAFCPVPQTPRTASAGRAGPRGPSRRRRRPRRARAPSGARPWRRGARRRAPTSAPPRPAPRSA